MIEPENAVHLKPWLVKTLEPICDAEPGALAEYILALLKHNAPESELRKEIASQLDEFLEKESPRFVEALFNVLRSKSYLPYGAPPPSTTSASTSSQPQDGGIPIPLDGLLNPSGSSSGHVRKRSFDRDDDLRPAKGPRLNADGQFSRYGQRPDGGRGTWQQRGERGGRMNIPGRADFMDGGMNGAVDGMNGRGPYRQQERRGICRDYHNNGYCARGAFCKYSHGDDAVIPAQLFPMNGAIPGGSMPFMPMVPNGAMQQFGMGGAAAAPYDPHERMDMRPAQGGPGRPNGLRAGMGGPSNGQPSHIQDLTPPPPQDEQMQQDEGSRRPGYMPVQQGTNGGQASMGSGDVDMGGPPIPPSSSDRGGGFRGGRGGGRGFAARGTFGGDAHSFRPERRDDKTLVVEKIPDDKLSLGSVNDWFSKFGTVTNVAVDANNAKALVSFSSHDEALAAWRSEDAVFGNRFVKVFWHRPMEGHGQKGAKMLAASASLVANIAPKDSAATSQPAPAAASTSIVDSSSSTPRKAPSAAATALAAKQQLLEQQIAEQKTLMGKLASASPAEKKEIMARLRKLNEEMKAPSTTSTGVSTPKTEDKELKAKEKLDKELEMHAAGPAESAEGEESTEELKARLAKLKAEAASLGLDTALESSHPPSSSYRPYRARGRGARSYYRGAGRGGPPPRASMKLDNRPKKLLVKGANGDQVQAVRDWYETTGQVDSVETTDSGDVLVAFKTRAGAEQALAKGTNHPTVGTIAVSWYTSSHSNGVSSTPTAKSTPPSTTPIPTPADATEDKLAPTPTAVADVDDDMHLGEPRTEDGDPEDGAVAGEWGGEDDAFGMM
ncbi:hypothetical protein EIP91_012290 [Steccherinum ochraceum]|uniref:RNA-binding protein 26 n=1 Tax=Steccherinum ochraceum TaxID=92696 RepID=A0A4R0RJ89_9APHY|nr:hypothetical protein EIP91_012290 [Steccherinum ochraceum]